MKLENIKNVNFIGMSTVRKIREVLSNATKRYSLMTVSQKTWDTVQSLDDEKRIEIESELIKEDPVLSSMDFFDVWSDAHEEETDRSSKYCEVGVLSFIILRLMKNKEGSGLKKAVSAGVLATLVINLIDWIRAFFVALEDQNGRLKDLYERTISIYNFDEGVKKSHKESDSKDEEETEDEEITDLEQMPDTDSDESSETTEVKHSMYHKPISC